MARVTLVPEGSRAREQYLQEKQLPVRYMEDFSVMGLMVSDYEEAVKLIAARGIRADTVAGCTEIFIEQPSAISEIQSLLETHNIRCSYGDIADTLYQA